MSLSSLLGRRRWAWWTLRIDIGEYAAVRHNIRSLVPITNNVA
jgi:hypothetical protein